MHPSELNENNLNEVQEDKLIMGDMTKQEEDLLVAKNHWFWYDSARFWQPHLLDGQDNFEALDADVEHTDDSTFRPVQHHHIAQFPA